MRVIAIAFILIVSRSLEASACPESVIWSGCEFDGVGQVSSNPSLSWGTGESWNVGDLCPYGCYNLPAGVLVANASGYCWTEIEAGDEYWVVSADEQTVFHFFADLHVTGKISGPGSIGGGIKDYGPYNSHIEQSETTPTVDFHRSFTLDHRAGEHFRLWHAIAAQGSYSSATATASGLIRFGGLPSGAYVISCQAYDVPVPAKAVTWGRVRATYR